jgi:D-glycero-D-manno-heptose 1,7-bisphosphate phosphatase
VSEAARRRRAVFLDRDGVLNDSIVRDGVPRPPRSVAEFRLLRGVVEACASLRAAGFALVVVTNQPDIARGTQTREAVDAMNDRLAELVELDEICVCPHDDSDDCECRKPRPGMLLEAGRRLSLDMGGSVCVGDRWRDIEAAKRAGVTAVHVDRGYREEPVVVGADAVVPDLPRAVDWIRSRFGSN